MRPILKHHILAKKVLVPQARAVCPVVKSGSFRSSSGTRTRTPPGSAPCILKTPNEAEPMVPALQVGKLRPERWELVERRTVGRRQRCHINKCQRFPGRGAGRSAHGIGCLGRLGRRWAFPGSTQTSLEIVGLHSETCKI